jgi:hypothetical protein
MSLLATASPWNNDELPIISKKRPCTMRKHIKPKNDYETDANDVNNVENMQNLEPTTIEQSQTIVENRNIKINDLLNQMTYVNQENDGSKLGNFNPPPAPILNNKKPEMGRNAQMELQPNDLLPKNPLQHNPAGAFYQKESGSQMGNTQYKANESNLGVYNNYKNSYEPSNIQLKPYYAKMGIQSSNSPGGDDKIMEKINYMIHLLEEQQNEKTNNVTEEFILYTFLGVFMIFIVDSFARAGKYVR